MIDGCCGLTLSSKVITDEGIKSIGQLSPRSGIGIRTIFDGTTISDCIQRIHQYQYKKTLELEFLGQDISYKLDPNSFVYVLDGSLTDDARVTPKPPLSGVSVCATPDSNSKFHNKTFNVNLVITPFEKQFVTNNNDIIMASLNNLMQDEADYDNDIISFMKCHFDLDIEANSYAELHYNTYKKSYEVASKIALIIREVLHYFKVIETMKYKNMLLLKKNIRYLSHSDHVLFINNGNSASLKMFSSLRISPISANYAAPILVDEGMPIVLEHGLVVGTFMDFDEKSKVECTPNMPNKTIHAVDKPEVISIVQEALAEAKRANDKVNALCTEILNKL